MTDLVLTGGGILAAKHVNPAEQRFIRFSGKTDLFIAHCRAVSPLGFCLVLDALAGVKRNRFFPQDGLW